NVNFSVMTSANRPLPSQPFYSVGNTAYYNGAALGKGMPIELKIAICNAANASCWINFPLNADDTFVTQSVQYTDAHRFQEPFYEYVNEPWNQNSLQKQLES